MNYKTASIATILKEAKHMLPDCFLNRIEQAENDLKEIRRALCKPKKQTSK